MCLEWRDQLAPAAFQLSVHGHSGASDRGLVSLCVPLETRSHCHSAGLQRPPTVAGRGQASVKFFSLPPGPPRAAPRSRGGATRPIQT